MSGITKPNLPTFMIIDASVASRNAEFSGTPLTDIDGGGTYADPYLGCNRGGSSAPGLGINSGESNPKLDDWSVNDQEENGRLPQSGQHLGGSGLGDGNEAKDVIRFVQGTDFTELTNFIIASQNAVDGAVADIGSGTKNETGAPVVIGDRLWGPS